MKKDERLVGLKCRVEVVLRLKEHIKHCAEMGYYFQNDLCASIEVLIQELTDKENVFGWDVEDTIDRGITDKLTAEQIMANLVNKFGLRR